jgi:deoxyribodipyrimidine photo-lyase
MRRLITEFSTLLQGEKFDAEGVYVRQWVPELAELPDEYIHQPWEAPDKILQNANVILGENYPKPIVDHNMARKRALDQYKKIKNDSQSRLK